MKKVSIKKIMGLMFFFTFPICIAQEAKVKFQPDFNDITFSTDIDDDVVRAIPPGFDPNAIEITYSTFVNGNLSVAGTITPAPGVGNSKQRSYFFPAATMQEKSSTTVPDTKFSNIYGSGSQVVSAWSMVVSTSSQKYLAVAFGLPTTIDTTVNPTIDLYIAVSLNLQPAGRMANFAINVNYMNSGNEIGSAGFDQTVTTGNLSITEPTLLTSNLRVYKVSATLNGALITPGCGCGLNFSRVDPTSGTEYGANLYFLAATFNFSIT